MDLTRTSFQPGRRGRKFNYRCAASDEKRKILHCLCALGALCGKKRIYATEITEATERRGAESAFTSGNIVWLRHGKRTGVADSTILTNSIKKMRSKQK